MVDTLVNGLTEGSALGSSSLTVTTTNADTVDNIALLGLEANSLVRSSSGDLKRKKE